MEAVLRALADESRRTVLETLADGEATAGELAARLPIVRPGVSRHLRVLREAGLVEVSQQAQRRIYRLRPQPLAEVDEWLGRYRPGWSDSRDVGRQDVGGVSFHGLPRPTCGGRRRSESGSAGC